MGGLNPAHVPYWRVNNPTLWDFCVSMIGRADIEGSKSNIRVYVYICVYVYPKYIAYRPSLDHQISSKHRLACCSSPQTKCTYMPQFFLKQASRPCPFEEGSAREWQARAPSEERSLFALPLESTTRPKTKTEA